MVQTFLLSINFEQSAKWLDTQRLGCQRKECLQILKALTDPDYGWQNHPCVKMWKGNEHPLLLYSFEVCNEWKRRGYKDTSKLKIFDLYNKYFLGSDLHGGRSKVYWLTEEFASNHRSILLGKAWEARSLSKQGYFNEVISLPGDTSKARKLARKYDKSKEVVKWYTQWNWTEEPAVRNENGKWPYLWPTQSLET